MFPTPELFDGLLLPSVLGGSKALILRLPGNGPYSRIISLAAFGTIKPYLSANIDSVCTHIGGCLNVSYVSPNNHKMLL